MELTQNSCAGFTEALASSAPTPGGGGAAALCGALAASLCAMAGNLTLGKPKYAQREERLRAVIDRAETLRRELLRLAEEDAAAFAPLSRAYAIPKDDPEREERLREASLNACRPPMAMLGRCGEAVELLEAMRELASPLLLSDVGCGAALCRGALEAAAMNVLVNTRGLRDDEEAQALNRQVHTILERYLPRAEAVAASVRGALES